MNHTEDPETFAEYQELRAFHHETVQETSATLLAFPRGPTGLTPDNVKFSPEFRFAKAAFNMAFAASRAFHGANTKRFAKELRAERDAKRQEKLK